LIFGFEAMAIALSPNELERIIEVLSSAGQALQLTRSERITYRTLLISVDVALASFLGFIPAAIFAWHSEGASVVALAILAFVFMVSVLVGIVSLALNIPLLLKTFREGRRLKQLGLNSLSTSLWKESRRERWVSRLRNALFLGIGILFAMVAIFAAVMILTMPKDKEFSPDLFIIGLLFYGITAGLLFGARYLRNQRERMDLAASAEQLREALQSLQQREGAELVSVPAELLKRTAAIESTQIDRERKDAVLQGSKVRSNAYAIGFDRGAAEQRAALSAQDRVELEDLVADLSTENIQHQTQAGTEAATLRSMTENNRVEIEYVIDNASRRIRVTAVKPGAQVSPAALDGGSDV
jgi:hypothetical protein